MCFRKGFEIIIPKNGEDLFSAFNWVFLKLRVIFHIIQKESDLAKGESLNTQLKWAEFGSRSCRTFGENMLVSRDSYRFIEKNPLMTFQQVVHIFQQELSMAKRNSFHTRTIRSSDKHTTEWIAQHILQS